MKEHSPASLPEITSVEVVSLKRIVADRADLYMAAAADAPRIILDGNDAQRIATLWRALPPGEQARCHCPPYGLRFLSANEVLCSASVCWACNNIFGEMLSEQFHYGLDGEHVLSVELLEMLQQALPISTLRSVIQRLRVADSAPDDWLYITGDAKDLTLDTEADLGCVQFDESLGKEVEPSGFAERGLRETIFRDTVEDCLQCADRLAGQVDDAAAADVIRYYIRFDAFPNKLNAPDPPPYDEIQLRLDREFCDKLGEEDAMAVCRITGCGRGVVNFSIHCRRHHFEKVWGRTYPFDE